MPKITDSDFEDNIEYNNFKQCALGREEFGKRLTELFDRVHRPMVVALDGTWGSGKSTFLQMWMGAHQNDFGGKSHLVFFDAFKHDFMDDPLTSIVGCIIQDETKLQKSSLIKLKEAGKKLAKPAVRATLAMASAGLTEAASAVGDAATAVATDVVKKEVDKFWETNSDKITAIDSFRTSLQKLVSEKDGEQSNLVVIVDELDRCRPDYALSVLEYMKHFFTEKNVHFILGVNLNSLKESIKARYGQGIDAEAYLKKFISITANIDGTNEKEFGETYNSISYLKYAVKKFDVPNNLIEITKDQLTRLNTTREISLRDIDQICFALSLYIETDANYYWGYSMITVTALLAKHFDQSLYRKILNGKVTTSEIGEFLGYCEKGSTFILDPDDPQKDYLAFLTWNIWTKLTVFPTPQEYDPKFREAFGGIMGDVYEDTLSKTIHKNLEVWNL